MMDGCDGMKLGKNPNWKIRGSVGLLKNEGNAQPTEGYLAFQHWKNMGLGVSVRQTGMRAIEASPGQAPMSRSLGVEGADRVGDGGVGGYRPQSWTCCMSGVNGCMLNCTFHSVETRNESCNPITNQLTSGSCLAPRKALLGIYIRRTYAQLTTYPCQSQHTKDDAASSCRVPSAVGCIKQLQDVKALDGRRVPTVQTT